MLALTFWFILSSGSVAWPEHTSRGEKFLNLLTVVRFVNSECTSPDGTSRGTCYTSSECQQIGGQADGSCAAGLGVCCIVSLGCGATVTNINNSYFTSQMVDSGRQGSCLVSVCPDDSICQLRLDFDSFILTQPFSDPLADSVKPQESLVSQCLQDTFSVTSPGNRPPPVICGNNSGYHMYVDSCGRTCNLLNVYISPDNTAFVRSWKIRVTQISCGSNYQAPDGCSQWFSTVTGTLSTFNNGGQDPHLASQDYTICIRPARGYCSICYWASVFQISNARDYISGRSEYDENCGRPIVIDPANVINPLLFAGLQDYITIPGGQCYPGNAGGVIDRYCGEVLACSTNADNSGQQLVTTSSVCSFAKPFELRVFTDEFEEQTVEDGTGPNKLPQKGFRIQYAQQPC